MIKQLISATLLSLTLLSEYTILATTTTTTNTTCNNAAGNIYLSNSNNTVTLNTYDPSLFVNTSTCPLSNIKPLTTYTISLNGNCNAYNDNSYSLLYLQPSCANNAALYLHADCLNTNYNTTQSIISFAPPNNNIDFDLTQQLCTSQVQMINNITTYYVIQFPAIAKQQTEQQQASQTTYASGKTQTGNAYTAIDNILYNTVSTITASLLYMLT